MKVLDSVRANGALIAASSTARSERARAGDPSALAIESWIDKGYRVVVLMHKGIGPQSPRGRSVAQAARLLRWPDERAARAYAMYQADLAGLFVDTPDGESLSVRACEIACGLRDPLTNHLTEVGLGLKAEETYCVGEGGSDGVTE
ncbi:MAG: hypothetical protein RIS45_389 [Planctomycetota bacterium]